MNEYKFSEFGNRIKMLREQKNIKQGQFADKIGITRQSMSNYESGKHSPDIDVIIKMADCLGCSTDYLMGLTEHSNYEKHTEFDDSLSKLSESLCTVPEQVRGSLLDIFIGTAQWAGRDFKGNANFYHSAAILFSTMMLLTEQSLTAKDLQEQKNYSEPIAQKYRQKRFYYMQMLRNELDNLDKRSFEYTEQSIDEADDKTAITELGDKLNKLLSYTPNKGDE